MALQSNAMAYMQKARQIQNENWHEDFFATMNNKVWQDATLQWTPGMSEISYEGLGKDDVTTTWSNYAKLAKQRGIRPDYSRFMETFKAVRANRDSKVLDAFAQLQTVYANNSDFKKALRNTMRTNPQLRVDLYEGMKTNPEHPGNPGVSLAFQDFGADPSTQLGTNVIEGLTKKEGPLGLTGMGSQTARTAIRGAGNLGQYALGGMAGKTALAHTFMPIPGYSTASHLRGMAGKGALADMYKGKGWNQKFKGARGDAIKRVTALGNNEFSRLNKNAKSLIAIGGDDAFKVKGKEINWKSNTQKMKWKKSIDTKLNAGIKDLKKLSVKRGKGQKWLRDMHLKELKNAKKELNSLVKVGKKGQKTISKAAMKKFAQKGLTQGSGKALQTALKKVGWGGIIKRAGWKLGAKIVASGAMKALTPFTAGVSGAISLGMDAWMVADLTKIAMDIIKEYNLQSEVQGEGAAQQYLEPSKVATKRIAKFQ